MDGEVKSDEAGDEETHAAEGRWGLCGEHCDNRVTVSSAE